MGRFKSVPVRFLIAPPGFGKTMALLGYLRHARPTESIASFRGLNVLESIWSAIAKALSSKSSSNSHEELVRALAARAPMELALDCEDVPDAGGIDAILALIEDVPDDVALLVACRSRAAFHVGRFVSEGTAVALRRRTPCVRRRRHPPRRRDAAACRLRTPTCSACSKPPTDGRKSSAARYAKPPKIIAASRKPSRHWRTRHGHLFNEFVAESLKHVSEHDADLVLKLMSGSYLDDRAAAAGARRARTLRRSHARRISSAARALAQPSLRSLRPPRRARSRRCRYASSDGSSLRSTASRLSGSAAATVRSSNIIALQPDGTVSRAEIGQVFWPDAERHLVAQSLRTACSNIRKAIAHIVGFKEVESYFRAGDELSIDLDNVIVDVNRFILHANDADEQYERGELRAAYAHYRSAARVYRGDLLIGDAHESWVASLDVALEAASRHGPRSPRRDRRRRSTTKAAEKPNLRLVSGLLIRAEPLDRAGIVVAALFGFGLQTSVVARTGFLMGDFRAFYCAARVAAHGDDPYHTEPLRTCERPSDRPASLKKIPA